MLLLHWSRRRQAGVGLSLLVLALSLLLTQPVWSQDTRGALTLVPGQNANDNDDVEVAVEENGALEENGKEPMGIFRPTREWQTVKPGQAIPSGLHVRMNLQTGEKEAKLMDNDRNLKYWEFDGKRGMINTEKKHFSREELKQALKDFKLESVFQESKPDQEGKKKFRNYEDLKKDFEKIQMKVKTEAEIVTELVASLNQSKMEEQKKNILTDLEYYLHQVDSAQLFCDLGGMQLLLTCLNDSAESIRSETAFVLGSALQSNPKVQIAAMEVGLMPVLLRMLVTETSTTVRRRALYALSGLVRQFPYAQQQLLKQGGLQAMAGLFSPSNPPSLGVRAATLITDLLQEQELAKKKLDPEESMNAERIRQYSEVRLREGLLAGGWCELVLGLLDSQDLDVADKVLSAMATLLPECRTAFLPAQPLLQQLRRQYQELSRQDPHPFHTRLLDTASALAASLRSKEEL